MKDKIIIEYDIPETAMQSDLENLYDARSAFVQASIDSGIIDSEVTIYVQGYNRLEKTKQCIENILKYTQDVDYDFILVDNGSTDGTYEYFKSVPHDKVRIIHISRNGGAAFPWKLIHMDYISKYLVIVANDIIVTPNWLKNMLAAAKSDPRIGMVNPVSSNVSNLQQISFDFTDIDDMQKKARMINVSDPAKWHERLRLITLGTMFKKECLYAIGLPIVDIGFFHDFADDDLTFRIRRAGYKAILAKDTWVHHNHDFRNLEDKDPVKFQQSLEIGRKNFYDKYFGIDAWDDVNNYIPEILPKIKRPIGENNCTVLGVDVRCGTPILEIKNQLRSFGRYDTDCCAITSDGKYAIDLYTVCGSDNVLVCRPENAFDYLQPGTFDYIIVGNNINEYPDPIKIVRTMYSLLKEGGQMFFYIKNTYDIYALLNIIGYSQVEPRAYAYNIPVDSFVSILKEMNINCDVIGSIPYDSIPNDYINEANKRVDLFIKEVWEETRIRLVCDKYAFVINKPLNG